MATIRLIPSTYSISNNVLTVSNATNMYTNTDNSSKYATATHTQKSTTSYYLYLKGFNFSAIPADATVNSFTVKIKAYESKLSTNSSYSPKLCNNTTTITGTCSAISTFATVKEFTGVTATWNTIKGYGNNFGIRFTVRRNQQNSQGYLYVYGAEILVDYSVPSSEQIYIKENGVWKPYSKVYKKTNGSWVEQTDLASLFDTTTNYVKGV